MSGAMNERNLEANRLRDLAQRARETASDLRQRAAELLSDAGCYEAAADVLDRRTVLSEAAEDVHLRDVPSSRSAGPRPVAFDASEPLVHLAINPELTTPPVEAPAVPPRERGRTDGARITELKLQVRRLMGTGWKRSEIAKAVGIEVDNLTAMLRDEMPPFESELKAITALPSKPRA